MKDKAIISAVLINLPLPSPLFENSFNIIIAAWDSIIITDLHYTIRGFGIIDIWSTRELECLLLVRMWSPEGHFLPDKRGYHIVIAVCKSNPQWLLFFHYLSVTWNQILTTLCCWLSTSGTHNNTLKWRTGTWKLGEANGLPGLKQQELVYFLV